MNRTISVKTNNLTKRFGKFVAVDNVSIEVFKGEIFGFLGANGAGKTTMIRMLCGLMRPSDGEGTVAGYNVYSQTEQIKRNIGYMSQKFSLYEDLTIEENIEFYGGIYGLSDSEILHQKEKLLSQLALKEHHKKITRDLPLGFRQRLALGCSLLHDPPVVFLDEPTSGVDPKARREFWDIIYRTAETGKTIFVTTHFMDEAEYCHRVTIMQQGKIIALDTPRNLRKEHTKANMAEVFVSILKETEGEN
jgi:ABC-2 type transport system ATP-binding protein